MKGILPRTVLVLVATHLTLFAALHLLEPELSPVGGIISDYSSTDSAWVATAAFVAFACLWVAVAAVMPSGQMATKIGRALLLAAAGFILLGAVFPSSVDPRTGGLLSQLQNLFARPGLFVGTVFAAVGLRRTPGWEHLGRTLVAISATALFLLVLTIAVLLDQGLGGVGQRLLFLLLYLWAGLVALRARTLVSEEFEKGSA